MIQPSTLDFYILKSILSAKTNLTVYQIETVCWYYGDSYSRNLNVKKQKVVKN